MDRLRKFDFYLDGNLITPRDLHFDFSTKILTYNIEIAKTYLENHDGRFHFTADFDNAVIFDVKLDKKIKSIVSSSFTNQVLFDGFNDEAIDKERTKSLFLKSLRQIKEATDDSDQIKRAEEQDSVIKIDVFKCLRNYEFGAIKPSIGYGEGYQFRSNNALCGRSQSFGTVTFGSSSQNNSTSSSLFGGPSSGFGSASSSSFNSAQPPPSSSTEPESPNDSKPVFVETSQVNASKWKTVDCTKDGKIMTVKIVIHIIEPKKPVFSVI